MSSLDFRKELKLEDQMRDTRTMKQKFNAYISNAQNVTMTLGAIAIACIFLAPFVEWVFLIGLGIYFAFKNSLKSVPMPMSMPMSSGYEDPQEGKGKKAKGIVYVGNDRHTKKEIWLTDTNVRTHMLFMGTTGSGKAQSRWAEVLTPNGWRHLYTLRPGDVVCTPEGGTTRVVGYHPQGPRRLYRLYLKDSAGNQFSEKSCSEHLWAVRFKNATEEEERICTTAEMILLLKNRKGTVKIPVVQVVTQAAEDGETYTTSEQSWVEVLKIKKDVREDTICISVESRDSLYVTKGDNTYIENPETGTSRQLGIVTHNTEYLISLVFNSLVHASSFIYVDGKGDAKLYHAIYSMVRIMCRDDDLLLLNFQTGASGTLGPQASKLTNSLNIFAGGSADSLAQVVQGLLGGEGGKQDMWSERANSFVEAIMKPLVFLRDFYNYPMDVTVVRKYFTLAELEYLILTGSRYYPGIERTLSGLYSYFSNLPGWSRDNMLASFGVASPEELTPRHLEKYASKHVEEVANQHGYVTMQLVKAFNSLADTYGYITATPMADINLTDVFLNRRILVVLLPALAKSPAELSNLGKIIVSALKSTMAVALGAEVEGSASRLIDARPTNSPSPFICVMDEYGYYGVKGFAIIPAQARSMGFSAVFAGQDLPGFEKADKEETKSILGNATNKFVGKLECVDTYEYFSKLAGQGIYAQVTELEKVKGSLSGLSPSYRDNQSVRLEKISRISQDDVRSHGLGHWHFFNGTKVVYTDAFYANPPRAEYLKICHLVRVARPTVDLAMELKNQAAILLERGSVRKDGPMPKLYETQEKPKNGKLNLQDDCFINYFFNALNKKMQRAPQGQTAITFDEARLKLPQSYLRRSLLLLEPSLEGLPMGAWSSVCEGVRLNDNYHNYVDKFLGNQQVPLDVRSVQAQQEIVPSITQADKPMLKAIEFLTERYWEDPCEAIVSHETLDGGFGAASSVMNPIRRPVVVDAEKYGFEETQEGMFDEQEVQEQDEGTHGSGGFSEMGLHMGMEDSYSLTMTRSEAVKVSESQLLDSLSSDAHSIELRHAAPHNYLLLQEDLDLHTKVMTQVERVQDKFVTLGVISEQEAESVWHTFNEQLANAIDYKAEAADRAGKFAVEKIESVAAVIDDFYGKTEHDFNALRDLVKRQ